MSLNVRSDFPTLTQKRNLKPLVYLDSAATTLKPWPVIERLGNFYSYETANVHRAAHHLSNQATENFEGTRDKVRAFLNARSAQEIVFTKGTTESVNLVANSFGHQLAAGDEILTTELEHHSNFVPWQQLCLQKHAKFQVAKVTPEGDLDWTDFESKISARTKLVAITHCSNVLGSFVNVEKAVALARKVGAKVFVDGAQWVGARPTDVQKLDCDFYAFSAHKLFGPYGVGVLYGKSEALQTLLPYQFGGSMIEEVNLQQTRFLSPPQRFEAGTPNISGVIALSAALDYVQKLGLENIQAHEKELLGQAAEMISSIEGAGILNRSAQRASILSVALEGCHPSDVAQILDQHNVAVRAGHLCAQPLLKRMGLPGFLRLSFSVYNNTKDLEILHQGLLKAKEMLQ